MSKFRILWIDDQIEKCERSSRAIRDIIENLGFEAEIYMEDDISEESLKSENGKLGKAIRGRNIDLFLIDYNLKNNLFGGDIIREIRHHNKMYSDIIFYSTEPSEMIECVKKSFDAESSMEYFDGVYVAKLDDYFVEKVGSVIEKIIQSWYNVHSIRGVLLSKASKFERMAKQIISLYYISALEKIKEYLRQKGDSVCQDRRQKWDKANNASNPILEILGDPSCFNWQVKKEILEIMCDEGIIDLSIWEDMNYIFRLRNSFAHEEAHLCDGVLVLTTASGKKVYDEEKIDEIRRTLMKIEDELDRLISAGQLIETEEQPEQPLSREICFV